MFVYFTAQGEIVRVVAEAEDTRWGPLPGTTKTVLDEETNAALVQDLVVNQRLYTIVGGVLRKEGVAITVAANGPARQEDTAMAALRDKILAGTALSAAEMQVAIRWLARRELRRG